MSEVLRIVGVWDRVIARDGSRSSPIKYPDIDKIPTISSPGNSMEINYEKVMKLQPDLFLTIYSPAVPGFHEIVKKLEPKITVVGLNFFNPESLIENIRKLGLILNQEDQADQFIKFCQRVEKEIVEKTSKIAEENKPRVFYKMGWGSISDQFTFTDAFQGTAYRNKITGSLNIAADLASQAGWVLNLDSEWLIKQDPDIIVDGGMYKNIFGSTIKDKTAAKTIRNKVMELDIISGRKAIKNNAVYLMWSDSFTTPSYIVSYAYLVKLFHPHLFKDFDPRAIHQEYLSRFLKVDLDLSQQGVFIYP